MKRSLIFILIFLTSFASAQEIIKKEHVQSISYLLASNKGMGRSSFGHAYLRFSYNEELSDDDLVVEFVADTGNEGVNALKGIGIGENYKLKVHLTYYSVVKYHHTRSQDRDLTSYQLDLDQNQMHKIVDKVNDYLNDDSGKEYAFFNANCARFVSESLNAGIDLELKGVRSVIPTSIPHLLKSRDLVISEFTDDRLSTQRKEIFDLYSRGLFDRTDLNFINLKDQLTSNDLNQRLFAYYKLHTYRSSFTRTKQRKINLLASKLLLIESSGFQSFFLAYFNNSIEKMNALEQPPISLSNMQRPKILKVSFDHDGEKVFLKVKMRYRSQLISNRKHPITRSHSFQLKDMVYRDGKIFNSSNQVISYKFSKKSLDREFYTPHTYLNAEIVKSNRKKYLKVHILLEDSTQVVAPKNLDQNDILAIENFDNDKGGVCLAHSELTQLLNTQAFYLPEETPLTEEENISLINDLLLGKLVFVPGHANALEFTSSIPPEMLKSIIKQRQSARFSFKDRFFDYFKETKISNSNFYNLKNLLALQLKPIIFFVPEGKRGIAHSITITSIQDVGDFYELTAIDPNFGFVEGHFRFNKLTSKLETSFYGTTEAVLYPLNLEDAAIKKSVFKETETVKLLKNVIKNKDVYSFYPYEIFK